MSDLFWNGCCLGQVGSQLPPIPPKAPSQRRMPYRGLQACMKTYGLAASATGPVCAEVEAPAFRYKVLSPTHSICSITLFLINSLVATDNR
jgi:hypothetical protein